VTPQHRADIAQAFKWAKEHLPHTRIFDHVYQNRFICNAITIEGGLALPGAMAAKGIIATRLGGVHTYDDWVIRVIGANAYQEDMSKNKGRKCQAARHAWLDSLIEEFSS
jgi:hypothetical protein